MRYRVYDPDTPRALPLELVQEWASEVPLELGVVLEKSDGEVCRVASVDPDPDPSYAGRVVLTRQL